MGRRVLPHRQGRARAARRRRPRDRPVRRDRQLNGPLALRVARALTLFVLGVGVGALTILTHGRPVGLTLGLLASAATALALPGGWSLRFAFTGGWTAVLAYVLLPRGAGGYLVASDVRGYLLLGSGLALMLFGILTVRPLRPPVTERAAEPPDPAP